MKIEEIREHQKQAQEGIKIFSNLVVKVDVTGGLKINFPEGQSYWISDKEAKELINFLCELYK